MTSNNLIQDACITIKWVKSVTLLKDRVSQHANISGTQMHDDAFFIKAITIVRAFIKSWASSYSWASEMSSCRLTQSIKSVSNWACFHVRIYDSQFVLSATSKTKNSTHYILLRSPMTSDVQYISWLGKCPSG